jgi:hypothetical protein
MKKTKIKTLMILIFALFITFGCASRFPTKKEWSQTPVTQTEKKEFILQGDFKNVDEFIEAAAKLKEGMSYEEVKNLGFSTNGFKAENRCDEIGWVEASEIVLQNTHLMIDFATLEEIIQGKKEYSGVRCKCIDIKSRSDRLFSYFNNSDTYKIGHSIKLVLIFKNQILFGINVNNQPVKEHQRESAFGKVIGDIFSPPKIESLTIK